MESNWRFNVWDYGMQNSDWLLAARYVGILPPRLAVKRRGFPGIYFRYSVPVPGQVPGLIGPVVIPVLFPHFPYGQAVIPD